MGLKTFDQIDRYLESKIEKQVANPVRHTNNEDNNNKTGNNKGNGKSKARDHRAKDTAGGIVKSAGYEELNEKEKDLCVGLTLQPNVYLELKKKLIKKAAKNPKLNRSVVVNLMANEMTKDKAFVIFDF